MTTYIALLRGINVGRAKRIAMADLRALAAGLGHADVRTVLNSGNVVFGAARSSPGALARAFAAAIGERFQLTVAVVVVTATQLNAIVAANPLADVAVDPSRHLVGFAGSPAALGQASSLAQADWTPDAFAVGPHAAYLWCAEGVLGSRLPGAFAHATGATGTTRNWSTVLRLRAAANAGRHE